MAMSGRIYTTGFQNVSVINPEDLIAVYAGSAKIFALVSVNIGQITGTTVANYRVRLRYLPTTVTAGSGGSAGTVARTVPGDAAATITSRLNDTTQATSSGTAVDIWDDVWNTVNGFLWTPPIPSRPPIIGLSGAFILSLDQAPSPALTISGTVMVEELP